jgi:group II intron reverse transcriptase/maturase
MAKRLKIRPDHGAFVVVVGVTPHQGVLESSTQGEGTQVFQLQAGKEEHIVQEPNTLLAILSKMALKPEVTFDKLFQKLYNIELWFLAYQNLAPKPGNMTAGVDGKTIDGAGFKLITDLIADLKASRYTPHPVRRTYIPKANGKVRPLGIPSFQDKLMQTVVKLILEAIYEPTFSNQSHGFRPDRSCHTALEAIKKEMPGTRWWVEGDIKGFFDHVNHGTLLRILSKRITDKRFLHLINQLLKAGYVEDWRYHRTYSGVPQGGNLSPVLANVYLNELDQAIERRITEFNKGKARKKNKEYHAVNVAVSVAKKKARATGDWTRHKALQKRMLSLQPSDQQDPNYRRLTYLRYADDFLLGVIGSKADAEGLKAWLEKYLKEELQLELSMEKTLITNSKERIRFLGYDIQRWKGERIYRFRSTRGVKTQRTGTYKLKFLMPQDKTIAFAKTYGNTNTWYGKHRNSLLNLSELEILMIYNAELRGFLGYYALADNLTDAARRVLWIASGSFFHTLAGKRQSTVSKVMKSMKRGVGKYVLTVKREGKETREYELVSSTRQLQRGVINYNRPDQLPSVQMYKSRTELGKRLLAKECEWCGTHQGQMEVHHIRKLKDLKGKTIWERQMIERRRKTMVLCVECHHELHAGKLKAEKRNAKGKLESRTR